MFTVLVILILIISVLLGLVVLVQNSKGGGLISNFGGANQVMGVRQTTDFLEKATWTMAVILVVLCLASSLVVNRATTTTIQSGSEMQEQVDDLKSKTEQAAPVAPSTDMPAEAE